MFTPFWKYSSYTTILVFTIFNPDASLLSQCTNGSQPECACETAPVLCTIDELDGYTYSMSAFQHPNDGPSPICPGANMTQTNNPTWFAFTAWCTDLTLRVSATNCVQSGGAIGFQLAIYEDCTFDNVVACNADIDDCTTDPKILNINGLNIGSIYYFMVDGCLGSYCNVTIDVIGICGQEVIAPWTQPVMGDLTPCIGNNEIYTVEDLDGARIYHWFLDGVLIQQTSTNSISIPWANAGSYQLCIDASNDPCVPISDPPLPLCVTITVNEADAGVLNVAPTLLCPTESTNIVSSGFISDADNSQILIITDASGLIIDIINASSGNFSSPGAGTFIVYAYNYITASGTLPVIGAHINTIDCNSQCCDLISQIITIQGIEAEVSNVVCDDNGTGNDAGDDVFYFDLLVTGQNVGTRWRSTDGTLEGFYEIVLHCGPYPITNGIVQFDLHDYDTPTCWTSISVFAPPTCSLCNQTIDAGPAAILNCNLTALMLNGNSSEPGAYQWSGPNLFSANTLVTNVSDSGWYYLNGLFANQCTFIDSVYVGMDRDTPVANAGPDLLIDCKNSEVTLNASASTGDHLQFDWLNSDGHLLSNQIILSVNSNDTYLLQLTNTLNGCVDSDTVEVSTHPNVEGSLIITVTPENCDGYNDGMISVTGVNGGTPPYSYTLNGSMDNSGQFINLSPGDYQIEVTDGYGCMYDTLLTVAPGIHLELNLPELIELVEGETGIIKAKVNVPADDLSSIHWTPAGLLSCDTCLSTTIQTLSDQTLNVTVVHINGCEANASLNIFVVPAPHIFIPNTFTPNGDGINDFFNLYSNDRVASILELSIFDRWGDHIYYGTNLTPNDNASGWDGMFKGKELNAGIFAYSFTLLMKDNSVAKLKGDITLLK